MPKLKTGTLQPSAEDDAAITAAALSDPDAIPYTDAEWEAAMRMKTPPIIEAARIAGDLRLEIDWSTGETLALDLSNLATPPFDALLDPAFFARMKRDAWGQGLDWPGGLDLGADRLYELCRQQSA